MKYYIYLIILLAVSLTAQEKLRVIYNVLENEEADNYEIYSMNLDGSDKKNISNWEGLDWAYYAYKDKIYFVSDRGREHRDYILYEMDADGNNVRNISDIRLRDSFLGSRKNGTEVIIFPNQIVDSVFYIINKSGNLIKKVDPGLVYFADPIFSPDGKSIVFRGAHKKSKREEGFDDELYIMNLDEGEPNQITHYPAEDTTAEWYAYHVGPPVWEPNRNIISFTSKQNGNYDIFAVNPDGTGLHRITEREYDEIYHFWSPDGKLIVFDGTDENENYDIYIMNTETKKIERLTTDERYEGGPIFVEVN